MGSPIDSWEGATAVFTGAHSSFSIGLSLLILVAVCVAPIVYSAIHEKAQYDKHS
ncbi:MAG: hypothetical protein AAF299_17640 [Pseudomonadota bacterium]